MMPLSIRVHHMLLLFLVVFMVQACGPHHKGTARPSPVKSGRYYYVKKGDTLGAISRKHRVSLSHLMAVNHISNPKKLQIGRKLIIPGKETWRAGKVKKNKQKKEAWREKEDDAPLEASLAPTFLRPRYLSATGFSWPIEEPEISSSFGRRFSFDKHHGIDLRAPKGTPVYAAADGVVIFSGREPRYGKMVEIRHTDDVITKYAHNHKNMVRVGQKVDRGQKIATVGSTGNASGNHLHFELIIKGRPVNPETYLP